MPSMHPNQNTKGRALRVAIVSHGHPELSHGGAEQASYAQFLALKNRPDIDPVYVAQCVPSALGHGGQFASFRGRCDEILWSPPEMDAFRLVSSSPDTLRRQMLELCIYIRPDIVHLHHVAGFGTDICRVLRQETGTQSVLTLHEYLAICNRWGQMVKTNGELCYESSFAECSACFPAISSGKFFLRKQLILENFSHVEAFIAPSEFLKRRYVEWGLEADRIRVIENPLIEHHRRVSRSPVAATSNGKVTRLGYFGQLTPFKGVDVLLDAMALLDSSVRQRVKLVLFGLDLQATVSGNRQQIAEKLNGLRGRVINYGPYRNDDVDDLMRSVDWVIVPSVWWENSPVVIQEARAAGVPVLCSNIGGMQEKVRPGIDGEHFFVANPVDLADKIAAIAKGRLVVQREPEPPADASIESIVDCYREILGLPKTPRPEPAGGVVARRALATILGQRGRALPAAEQHVVALYGLLSGAQRAQICFAWDHVDPRAGLLRKAPAEHWPRIASVGELLTPTQRALVREIVRHLLDPEWYPLAMASLFAEGGSPALGERESVAILGDPSAGPFQFLLRAKNVTLRSDGGSSMNVAFGGAIRYGLAADASGETPNRPGSMFWPLTLAATHLYDALNESQRAAAVVDRLPDDTQSFRPVHQGLQASLMTGAQKSALDDLLGLLLAPFRGEDRDRMRRCIERQGGLDRLSIAFTRRHWMSAPHWDEWRLEGPSFIWHVRSWPGVDIRALVADREEPVMGSPLAAAEV